MPFVIFALLTKNQNKSVSVNQFANLCPFIIHKNEVFLKNSDENIYFFFCSGFHVQSKASANIIGQRARICQGNATHNRNGIVLMNVSSLFLLSRLSSHRHVQQIALLSAAISGDYTAAQFKPNMYQHTTAQGKENLPAPSVSPRVAT